MQSKIDVLLPVFNGQAFIKEAVESILNQSYASFRLLIVDDGSTDNTVGIIKQIKDPRIELLCLEQNLGVSHALNFGLARCTGDYIVRMDADDVALPHRLERQVRFMNQHPKVGVCGSWFIDFDGQSKRIIRYATEDQAIRIQQLYHAQIAHPTAIIRSSILHRFALRYDESFNHCEDYELWTRIGRYASMANIPEILVNKRDHEGKISYLQACNQQDACARLKMREFRKMEMDCEMDDVQRYVKFCYADFSMDENDWNALVVFLEKLLQADSTLLSIDRTKLHAFLNERWMHAILNAPVLAGKRSTWLRRLVFKSKSANYNFTLWKIRAKSWLKR